MIESPPQQGHILNVPVLSSNVTAAKKGLSNPIDLPKAANPLSIFFCDAIAFGVLNFETIVYSLYLIPKYRAKSQYESSVFFNYYDIFRFNS